VYIAEPMVLKWEHLLS